MLPGTLVSRNRKCPKLGNICRFMGSYGGNSRRWPVGVGGEVAGISPPRRAAGTEYPPAGDHVHRLWRAVADASRPDFCGGFLQA